MSAVSITSFKCASSNRGFTLIEIIVVVAIIAVMVSAIGFSMSNDADRIAKWEAKHFQSLVNDARDEAIFMGRDLVLLLNKNEDGYRVQKTLKGKKSDELFSHKLNPSVELSLQVSQVVGADKESLKNYVILSSLGEVTPFKAGFKGNKQVFHVFIDENNLVRLNDSDGI